MKTLLLAALTAASLGSAVQAATPADAPASREVSIPFVDHMGLRDWQAIDDRSLYIQDHHKKWYLAKLMTPCFDLPFANAIGIETFGGGSFDRFASIRVRGERCRVESLVASDPPPVKVKAKTKRR